MPENKEEITTLARMFKNITDYLGKGKEAVDTKLAAAQTLKPKDGTDAIEVDESGAVTSGQADGEYVLEDGSTVTIKDGKIGEVKPAEKADDKSAADAPAEDKSAADAPPADGAGEADKPVTQSDLKALVDAVAAIAKQVDELSKTELASKEQVTKLSAELEEVKRQPAVNKQGPPTLPQADADLTKLSVPDHYALMAQKMKSGK